MKLNYKPHKKSNLSEKVMVTDRKQQMEDLLMINTSVYFRSKSIGTGKNIYSLKRLKHARNIFGTQSNKSHLADQLSKFTCKLSLTTNCVRLFILTNFNFILMLSIEALPSVSPSLIENIYPKAF